MLFPITEKTGCSLFSRLGLKERLRRCFSHLTVSPIFGYPTLVLCLVVHLLLGYRQLRDLRYYADDPLVKRTLGLRRLPDVATVSRGLARADQDSVREWEWEWEGKGMGMGREWGEWEWE